VPSVALYATDASNLPCSAPSMLTGKSGSTSGIGAANFGVPFDWMCWKNASVGELNPLFANELHP
jgi:hypothetical protein